MKFRYLFVGGKVMGFIMNKVDRRYQNVFNLANNAKNALIDLFNENGRFSDNDKMLNGGLMADAVGLTAIMLIDIAFCGADDGYVIKKDDKERISVIINSMLPQLYKKINKFGYTADPIISRQKTKNIFNKTRGNGSTDTITWLLSLCSITRYAHRNGFVNLSDECLEIVADIAAETILLLHRSQLPDGTWGFMTNEQDALAKAKRSLYFSYTVSQCYADFFDYIRGDLENPNENYQETYQDYYDKEFVEMLEEKIREQLGKGVIDAVYESRQKLQDWIITYCLPVLPIFSACKKLPVSSDELQSELKALGVWTSSTKSDDGDLNYFNLYYTNYILDMIITSEVDNRFDEIKLGDYIDETYGGNPSEKVKDSIQYRILQSYKDSPYIPNSDKEFFLGLFSNEGITDYRNEKHHIESFLENYYQQAIHNSRAMYMASSHSNKFWEQSELIIEWEHDSPTINSEISSIKGITDPAFVPMALRTNASYCFYKAESGDFFVDNLFEYIYSDVFSKQSLQDGEDEDDYEFCVDGLWDTMKFNLFVTERSVEAIVDYFDYLNKLFPRNEVSSDEIKPKIIQNGEKERKEVIINPDNQNDLELALEKRMEAFLMSEKGKSVLRGILPALSQTAESFSFDDLAAFLKEKIILSEDLKNGTEKYTRIFSEDERRGKNSVTLPYIDLFFHLTNYSLIEKIFSVIKQKSDEPYSSYQERVFEVYKRLSKDVDELLSALINGIECSGFQSSDLKKWWQTFKTNDSSSI